MIEQHKTLAEKFIKKGFWLYLFSFIIAPIGYIIKIIISGELSVEEVGILYGIISLISLIGVYNDLGMTESLKHFIPKFITEKRYDKVKTILAYAFFSQLITSFFISSFFFFGADFISNNYFKSSDAINSLKIFSVFFVGINIFQVMNTFFMAVQNTFYQKITEAIRMLFIMFCVLFIFFGDLGSLENYSYSWVFGLYIGIVFSTIIFYKKYFKNILSKEIITWDKDLGIEVFKYASLVLLSTSAATLLGQMDMQMIIYLLGTKEAGFYSNYLSIISIPFMFIGPIFAFLFPVFSELHSKKDYKKIKLVKQIFSKNFILIGIMSNGFLFVFSQNIAYTLFGEKFIESGIILKYSILLLVFNFLLQINFNILSGIGKVKERVKIILIAVIFNFIANIFLINSIGVYGAALATSMGWILIWLMSEYFLGKFYFVKYDFGNILKNVFCMGILGFLSFKYFSPAINGFSRLESLGFLFIFMMIWCCLFVSINYSVIRSFILEVKRLRK